MTTVESGSRTRSDSGFVWVVSLKGSGRHLVGSLDGVSLTAYS